MRILIPTTWYPLLDDPVRAVFVRRHVEALALRHDVEVLALLPPGAEPVPADPDALGLTVRHVSVEMTDPRSVARAVSALRRHAAATRPDVIHSMGFSSLPFSASLTTTRRPWVHTEHWSGVTHPQSIGRGWNTARGVRHLLRLPRRVTAVSSDMAGRLRAYARVNAVDVVGNVVGPVTPAAFDPSPGTRLLAIGSLITVKDPLLAVRIVGLLRGAGHDVTLRWAGSGGLDDAMRRAALNEGVSDHVFLLGSVPPNQLAEHHAWSTCFLLPTRHETFCVAAAEALAHGRPVVLGAHGGQRDFVTDDVGVLVDSRDPAIWARSILAGQNRFRNARPERFAAAVQRFQPEQVAEAFDRVYALACR